MANRWMDRYGPWAQMDRLQREMNRLFQGRTPSAVTREREFPPVSISARGEDFIIRAELPGMRLEDIDLAITGSVLTIRGERSVDDLVAEAAWQRRERETGSFVRAVRLPEQVVADKAEAHYTNGILEVRIPKSPETQPRRIAIQPQENKQV